MSDNQEILTKFSEVNDNISSLRSEVSNDLGKVTDSLTQMSTTLAVHTDQLKRILGNGRPGLIDRMDADIDRLQKFKNVTEVKLEVQEGDLKALKSTVGGLTISKAWLQGGWWTIAKILAAIGAILTTTGIVIRVVLK